MKLFYLSMTLIVWMFISCKDDITPIDSKVTEKSLKLDNDFNLRSTFAINLAKAMETHKSIRDFIKYESLKQFDLDYDILYENIKNCRVEGESSFRDIIKQYFKNEEELKEIEKSCPLLTIYVPELPENSFSAEIWNTINEIPKVAVISYKSKDVAIYDSNGDETFLPKGHVPGFPVLVVKNNERVRVSATTKTNSNTTNYEFIDECFDGSKHSIPQTRSDVIITYDSVLINTKLVEAESIYRNVDGWQRDYIYYNITPQKTHGEFCYDYQDCICFFSLGDINNPSEEDGLSIYYKIRDSSNDPYSIWDSFWTDGKFEFLVKAVVNGTNGVGSEIHQYFQAGVRDIFSITWNEDAGGTYYPSGCRTKEIRLRLPLISWNINDYSTTMKISIEEVDPSTTTVYTEERSTTIAQNFDFTFGAMEKIGLKFGASNSKTITSKVQRTVSEGNDDLGEVIVNFADKYMSYETIRWVFGDGPDDYWEYQANTPRYYYSGNYSIGILPVQVQ